MEVRKLILCCSVFILMASDASKGNDLASARQCAVQIIRQEKKLQIPKGLLYTISKIESGRKIEEHPDHLPWPWVINANGKGMYFQSKGEAIREVNRLLQKGLRNIDIGCMQINYHHHGHRFKSLHHMFDPRINVEYGAKFLTDLRREHGTWTKAVGLYHSATLKYQVPYKKKVYEQWMRERSNINKFMLPFYGGDETLILPPIGDTHQQDIPLYFMIKPTNAPVLSGEQKQKNRLKTFYSPAQQALYDLRARRENQQRQYQHRHPHQAQAIAAPPTTVEPTLFPAVTGKP